MYKLLHIILLESFFKRADKIEISGEKSANNLQVDTAHSYEGRILSVTTVLKFSVFRENIHEIDSMVKMAGIFETPENPEFSVENFATINAPAIIFPFIREHLASVSMKAGMPAILLPPINFVKMAEDKNTKQE